jgi:uncharacterized membrane protein
MWIHLLTAMVWIGGLLFFVMVLVPLVRQPDFAGQAAKLIQFTGNKFKRVAWASLLTLTVTGFINLYCMSPKMTIPGYGHMVGTKILLVLIVMSLSLYHDFKLGPAALQAMTEKPGTPETLKLRKKASMIGRANLLLSLIIMTLALFMVRGLPVSP